LKKQMDELRAKTDKEEQEHDKVVKSQKELEDDIKKTEENLEKATDNLRTVREGQVNAGGAVYRTGEHKKSGAPARVVGALSVALALAFAF